MFELPIRRPAPTSGRKNLDKRLKTHVNKLKRSYDELETDKSDETNNIKQFDNSHSQEMLKKAEHIPFITYETWARDVPQFDYSHHLTNQGDSIYDNEAEHDDANDEEDGEEDDNGDDEDENENDDITKIKTKEPEVKPTNLTYEQIHYMIRVRGLEVLPHTLPLTNTNHRASKLKLPDSTSQLSTKFSYIKRHAAILTKLLHLNILKREWKTAHRCFALLIRLRFIDLKSLWPLGLEILIQLNHEKIQNSNKSGNLNDYDLRTLEFNKKMSNFDIDPNNQFDDEEISFDNKDEQYLNWLGTFNPILQHVHENRNYLPFPFRVGTTLNSPIYVSESIWNLIIRGKFELCDEKLDELLVMRPYINDGLFFYLKGFVNQLKIKKILKKYDYTGRSIEVDDKETIEKLFHIVETNFKIALEKGNFEVDSKLIKNELIILQDRVFNDVNNLSFMQHNNDESSDSDVDDGGSDDSSDST